MRRGILLALVTTIIGVFGLAVIQSRRAEAIHTAQYQQAALVAQRALLRTVSDQLAAAVAIAEAYTQGHGPDTEEVLTGLDARRARFDGSNGEPLYYGVLGRKDAWGTIGIVAGRPLPGTVIDELTASCLAIRAKTEQPFAVLAPIVAGVDREWLIPVVALDRSSDRCIAAGVLIRSAYFNRMLAATGADFALLVETDGTIVARLPDAAKQTGRTLGSSSVFAEAWRQRAEDTIISRSPVDGRLRINHYSALSNFPIIVAVGFEYERVAGPVRDDWIANLSTAALFSIFLVLIYLVGRRVDRRGRAERRRRAAIMEAAADGIHVLDQDGRLIEVNRSFCDMLGYSERELIGAHISLWDSDWAPAPGRSAGPAVPQERQRIEATFRRKDGREFPVEIMAIGVKIDGEACIYASARDVSARLAADLALRRSESRFRAGFDQSAVGMVHFQPSGRIVRANRAFADMVGHDPASLLSFHLPDLMTSSDVERDAAAMTALTEGAVPFIQLENRYVHKDGQVVWALTNVMAIRGENDRIDYFSAVVQDISRRRRMEEQVALAALVFDSANEGIIITNPRNEILSVNRAFTLLTGYAAADVIGKNPRILSSGENSPAFYAAMWREMGATGHWQGEIRNRRKNGEVLVEWLSIRAVRGDDGAVERYVGVFTDITERKRNEETAWRHANYDWLTDLPNRRLFRDRLEQEIKKAHRDRRHLAVFFVDLDRFKEVNDSLGHRVGDSLLVEAAVRIGSNVRSGDTVARIGGDEFTVILPGIADLVRVDQIAQALIAALSNPFEIEGETVFISASIGVALFPHDAATADDLLKAADQAMFAAKNAGRNCYRYFTDDMQRVARSHLRISNDLRYAVNRGQLRAYFQPIVEMSTGRIVKAEALMRWQHPELGLVGPADFIPVAEESGVISELGEWIFRETARQVKAWRDVGAIMPVALQVSVNKSPRQFLGNGSVDSWIAFLDEIGLDHGAIAIEITERLLLDERPEVTRKLAAYRQAGIELAIDDFGTGYSAMAYLTKFRIDYLKIDRSFVAGSETDPGARAIVEAIVAMAHRLDIKVIAEGIETEVQRRIVAASGCDYGQGYLFGRPVPADDFMRTVTAQRSGER